MIEWISVKELLPQPVEEMDSEIFPLVIMYDKYDDPEYSIGYYDTDSDCWCDTFGVEVDPPMYWASLNPPSTEQITAPDAATCPYCGDKMELMLVCPYCGTPR